MTSEEFDLERFTAAQRNTYEHAVAELGRGQKTSHWMWFVFPQIAGLGMSATSRRYAISSLAEARAYLAHPVLGARLIECSSILAGRADRTAEQIFGSIDAQKLRSSMTLFLRADPAQPVFAQVLAQYYGGAADAATDERIQPLPLRHEPIRARCWHAGRPGDGHDRARRAGRRAARRWRADARRRGPAR